MTEGLYILLLSALPAVLYILIIFFTVPYKKINLRTAFAYLIVGLMSVGVLRYFWMAVPEWRTLAISLAEGSDAFTYSHFFYFIQVGLAEELAKLTVFLMVDKYRRNAMKVKDHPVATMFYVAMVSLGFSIVENVHYASFVLDPEVTLYWRSFTAVVAHMVFGLFMGYWIALGRMGNRFRDKSLFDIVINKRKRLRNIVYIAIGVLAASTVHGIYDLHLDLNGARGMSVIYIFLGMCLLGAYWCFKNLNSLHRRKVEKMRDTEDVLS